MAKIIGVICFCFIYIFYYKGGDTISYFQGSKALSKLLVQDFDKGFQILFNTSSYYNDISTFNRYTGWPMMYMWLDKNTFFVCRISSVFSIISFNSFLTTSILSACFSYIGMWKIYRLFNEIYPESYKYFAFSILFIPSLCFWGSGIMKDSFVLGSTCWITYNFYMILIKRKKVILNILLFSMNLILIINIKSYIIISLIPGMLIWLNSQYIKSIKNLALKLILFPVIFSIIVLIGFYSLSNLSSLMGVYGDMDTAIQQAQVIQGDLLREDQYGSNSYNIGELDGTLGGLISVAPIAIFTALFRPLFWEIGSPTMAFSVIENTILLLLTFYLLFKINPFTLIKFLLDDPFLLYCFIFSILFAFGVGIAGTNFGALVRYKIPLVPFFFSSLYVIYRKVL